MLTTPYAGDAAWDAAQAFRVERTREPVLLPTPMLAAPHRRARARGRRRRRSSSTPRCRSASLGRELTRRAVGRRAARRRGHGARPAARAAARCSGGCCAPRPASSRRGSTRRARRCAPRAPSSPGVVIPPGRRRRPVHAGGVGRRARRRADRGSGSIPTGRRSSRSAGSCRARASTCCSTRSRCSSSTCSSRSRATGATGAGSRRARDRLGLGDRVRFLGRVPDADLPARLPRRRRVRDGVPRALGRARGRGVRHRVPRGGRVRAARRSRGAAAGRTRRWSTATTGFVVDPGDVDAARPEPRAAARRRRRRRAAHGRRGPGVGASSAPTTRRGRAGSPPLAAPATCSIASLRLLTAS